MAPRELLLSALREFGFVPGRGPVRVDESAVRRLVEKTRPIVAPDVVCAMVGGADGDLVNEFQGVDGFAGAWSDWLATFETLELHAEILSDAGDYVVALGKQVGKSAMAGVEIESEAAGVWLMPAEKVLRVEFHLHRDAALRSAGLEPADYSRQE